jgi:hypothetical protein
MHKEPQSCRTTVTIIIEGVLGKTSSGGKEPPELVVHFVFGGS